MDKARLVAGTYLFRGIPADELTDLVERSPVVHKEANETIIRKGDPGDSMMVVLTGRVRVCCYSEDGKELTLNIIAPGQ